MRNINSSPLHRFLFWNIVSENQSLLHTNSSENDSDSRCFCEEVMVETTTASAYDHLITDITDRLVFYYCPVLVVLGTIGNILSIMVFSRKTFKASAMSMYIRFIAVSDLATLFTGPIVHYVNACCDVDINVLHDVLCRTYKYRVYLFTDVSTYTIIALTSERLCSVIFPHRVRLYCAKRKSYYVLVIIVISLSLANCPLILWSYIVTKYDESTGRNKTICDFQPEPSLKHLWSAFDLFVFCLIPVSFITVANVILLVQLYGYQSCGSGCRRKEMKRQEHNVAEMSRQARKRKQKSVTITLMFVSIIYLICNLPVVLIGVDFIVFSSEASKKLGSIVADLLMFTNNCVNFLLYCTCGSRFRNELVTMLFFRCNSPALKKWSSSIISRN